MTSWQDRAAQFKAQVNDSIPPDWKLPDSLFPLPLDVSNLTRTCGLLSNDQLEILSHDATGLRDAIASWELTAVEVTEAFCIAAAVQHQSTNCLMEFFPAEAKERAKWLDAELERTGKVVGPLHGIPVSIKDICALKGHKNTMGILSKVTTYEYDAPTAAVLRKAGAVFYAKTSVPQAVMHLETDSFLGPTLHPMNTKLTPGGSSGGESAMLCGGASVMGLGTDIGGSIRSPAALCGIYGFKPTVGRLPLSGIYSPMTGQASITGTNGPMTISSRDLSLFMSVALSPESAPWRIDCTCVKMPWSPQGISYLGGNRTMPRIGVMRDDGVVMPQPPMRRALHEVIQTLRGSGVEVIEVDPRSFDWKENWEIARASYFTEGGSRLKKILDETGEPMLPLTQWIVDQGRGVLTAEEIIQLASRRSAHQAAFQKWFNDLNVDVVLCPPGPGPAPELGTSRYWGYTSMFNVLDVPSGVLPSGCTVEQGDAEDAEREWWSQADKEVWQAYSPDKFLGLPLGVQVVGLKWEDEKVVAAIEIIDQILLKSRIL